MSKEMSEWSIEERVADTLHERATRDVPYNLNLWPQISSRAKQRHTYRGMSRLPFRRPNLVVAAYLAILVVAVALTFSLAPTLKSDGSTAVSSGGGQQQPSDIAVAATQEASGQHTPLPSITPDATATQYTADYNASKAPYAYLDRSKYGKHVGISQTSGDYTVTINWMYADGNRLLIDFDLLGPQPDPGSDRRFTPYVAALSVKDGPTFSAVENRSSSRVEGNKAHYLVEKDAAFILDKYGDQELEFNLTIAVDAINIKSKAGGTVPGATATWVADSQDVESIRERDIAGPFSFQLSVPFIPARTAGLLQTASANNVEMALQQVRVSPAEIRSYILVASGDKTLTPDEWQISAGAQVNDWDALMFRTGKTPFGRMVTSTVGEHTIYDNVYDQEGEWTFTVRQLLNSHTQETIQGPWVFKFEFPQAGTNTGRWRLAEQSPVPYRGPGTSP
ncbi:MAG TPA: DUF4179 domain-containing protein [Chloroflexia bacterium]|nr:DUF4179 domain-containing protein [Chloroflexia bacterium]